MASRVVDPPPDILETTSSFTMKISQDFKLDMEAWNHKKTDITHSVCNLQSKNRFLEIQMPVSKASQNSTWSSIWTSEYNPESFRTVSQRLATLLTGP